MEDPKVPIVPECDRLDAKALRQALGCFVTGVTVITTAGTGEFPRGFAANSFTSVSLDPPLVLFCIAKNAKSLSEFSHCNYFAVNVLAEDQKPISSKFASKDENKFSSVAWRPGQFGSPILDGVVAWFECRAKTITDAGDHIIVLGEVLALDHSPATPLGYCRGAYLAFHASEKVLSSGATQVGAVLENDQQILFVRDPQGRLGLPCGRRLGPDADKNSLLGSLRLLGIEAKLDFLFAVFERHLADKTIVCVFYRGAFSGPVLSSTSVEAHRFNDIPWDRFDDTATVAMLRRYVREKHEGGYGIYVGDADTGIVKPVKAS